MDLNSSDIYFNVIDSFKGPNIILSNFYENINYPFVFDGLTFISGEAAFQSAKTLDMEIRKRFCNLHPKEAKILGHQVELRPDWEEIKDEIMYQVVKAKFTSHPTLRRRLTNTYPKTLIEGNTWHDNHFGSCICQRCKNKNKKNILGKTLMSVREEMILGQY